MTLQELSRRDFLRICTAITATLGLPYAYVEKVQASVQKKSPLLSGYTLWSALVVQRLFSDPPIHLLADFCLK